MPRPYALDGMIPVWNLPTMPHADAYRRGNHHLETCPRCAFAVAEDLDDTELCPVGRLLNARLRTAMTTTYTSARWN